MPPRNNAFADGRRPFRAHDDESHGPRLQHSAISGPFSFLNPTRARFALASDSDDDRNDAAKASQPYHFSWRSRDNRKGRHRVVVHKDESHSSTGVGLPARSTSHPAEVSKVIWRMLFTFPVWDISWLVAYIYTWGSITWCVNGFFSFLPLIRPSTQFPNESVYAGGISAFVGAVIFFEFGSVLLMFEAVNANNSGCFGWAVKQLVDEPDREASDKPRYALTPSVSHCQHHHRNKHNLVGRGNPSPDNSETSNTESGESPTKSRSWRWFPTMYDLKAHYLHELGFLASLAQFMGATIFSIAGFTALPGINNKMSPSLTDGIYWAPQVVGGCGFVISGILYLLESQKNWYTPAPGVLGWQIAFWNLIGGIGFTMCGALGFAAESSSGANYQAACSTFWGSFAFLIGSVLQLYESLEKYPVDFE